MSEPTRTARRLVITDTEYTNLDTEVAQVVEIAYAVEDGPIVSGVPPHSLAGAEPKALEVNQYFERGLGDKARWNRDIVDNTARALAGQVLVGCNPRVDARVLQRLIGYEAWHYRLGDLESAAWLMLGFDEPPGLRQIRDKLTELGFEIPRPDHTAGGDVEVTRACLRILQRIAGYQLRTGLPTSAMLAEHETSPANSLPNSTGILSARVSP